MQHPREGAQSGSGPPRAALDSLKHTAVSNKGDQALQEQQRGGRRRPRVRLSTQHPALATCTHHSSADGRGRPSQQRSIHSICPQLKPDALPSAPGEGQTPLRAVCTAVAAAALATEGRRPQRYPYRVSATTVQCVASLRPSYLQKQKQDQDESETSMTTGHPRAPAALHPPVIRSAAPQPRHHCAE